MIKKYRFDEFGYEVELGKFARQADGAIWFKQEGTVVLATVVSAPSKDFPGFFPLTIDYRELFSAAGKIPGGYYKREGKPSDKEVLTGRLIDRAVRPLFPEDLFDSVQVLATVYSVDKEHAPNVNSLIASSLALTISNIPFLGPVGAVEMCRVNGEWKVNPSYQESKDSDGSFIIAGTKEGICMVEGASNELSEKDFIDVLFRAHEYIKKLVEWQLDIQKEFGVVKKTIQNKFSWSQWADRVRLYLNDDMVNKTYIPDKVERNEYLKEIRQNFIVQYTNEIEEGNISLSAIEYIFDFVLKERITDLIFVRQKRIDSRDFQQIRPITVEVGVLPGTHGSSLFTRGRTQALVSVTLGSGHDEQKTEGLMEEEALSKHFMLHYNFPPFSVGEVRPVRGPGRREVGHGYLAASAQRMVLPEKKDFSYTIRVVADMLESDGSTSMATTCGATMALMHAGVPIKKMVSGIAMGLLKNQKGDFFVLSDISGFEDAFGLMDFKVTGTEDGITAVQMDIKYKGGLKRNIFEKALEQAREGRIHILSVMKKCMTKPNETLSDLVPKLITVQIQTDKIGAIIGPGGKTIREITEKTGTEIDIEQDGLIKIFGDKDADTEYAVNCVKTLAGQIEVGTRYKKGKIRRITEFGIFVEIVPQKDGLVRIESIPRDKQKTFMNAYKVNDEVVVEVTGYDAIKDRIRLKLIDTAS